MNNIPTIHRLCIILLVLLPHVGFCDTQVSLPTDWQLNQIQINSSGLMVRSGGDPYIVFPPLKTTEYSLKGIQAEIAFFPVPDKPLLMELFWKPSNEGFSELRKVFFTLPPPKTGNSIKFFLPLNNKEGYRQFRLDFPRDLTTQFQVKNFDTITDQSRADGVTQVESFYRLTVTEALTPEIIIPYLVHAIHHGLKRVLEDPAFLVTWLLLILAALTGCRVVSKSIRHSTDPGSNQKE